MKKSILIALAVLSTTAVAGGVLLYSKPPATVAEKAPEPTQQPSDPTTLRLDQLRKHLEADQPSKGE